MVVPQHTAEALPAPDIACILTHLVAGIGDPVPKALVIALPMVVGDELLQSTLK